MTAGTLIVTAQPSSPDEADAFNRWYDETHVPEMLAIDGFVAAQRYAAVDGESYVTIYEADDITAAQNGLAEARRAGTMSAPVSVRLDPPPTVQWYRALPAS